MKTARKELALHEEKEAAKSAKQAKAVGGAEGLVML
jgi:hypothetical protein